MLMSAKPASQAATAELPKESEAANSLERQPNADIDAWRWNAVATRERSADGVFYYSVRTTGVYCKPSCASRPALRKNVAFHETCAAAELAGFRACKRCKPSALVQPGTPVAGNEPMVARICRLIEEAETLPKLDELAAQSGLSRYHFHRVFKAATGLTPRDYAVASRSRRLREKLAINGEGGGGGGGGADSITSAFYEAGFNSSGRFYADSGAILGMTPSRYRAGGAGTSISFAVAESSLGAIVVAATDKGVCAVLMGDDPDLLVRDLQDRFPRADLKGGDAGFEKLVSKVVGLVESPGTTFDLPLDVKGTVFQQRVWQALRQVPAGSTASYTEIANSIGLPRSVRAVAAACAANHIAVVIPCHRVVRSDGGLSGYRWGVERKRELLARESARAAE